MPILVAHFLAKLARRERRAAATLSPEALKLLATLRWPGNVRELENAIERAVAVAKGNVVLPSDLPPEVGGGAGLAGGGRGRGGGGGEGGIIADRPSLAELERRYIQLVLSENGGNKKKAAEKLGIDRRTLYRALERTGDDGGRSGRRVSGPPMSAGPSPLTLVGRAANRYPPLEGRGRTGCAGPLSPPSPRYAGRGGRVTGTRG